MLCDHSCGMLHAYDSSGLVLRQQRDGAGQNLIRCNIHPCTANTLNNGFPKPATQNAGRGYISAPARKIIDASYVRTTSPTFLDYWSQPRLFFQSMSPTEQQLAINAAQFELAKVSSETVRKAVIAQFNRISNDLAKQTRVHRPRSPRTHAGHVVLSKQDERRLDLRNTLADNQDPHRRDPCQRIFLILPLSGRHHRYRPQGQGRRPKELGPVPSLGRRRDVLHRACRAIRRHHRRRRHRRPVLEEGLIGNAISPRPPGRDRARCISGIACLYRCTS